MLQPSPKIVVLAFAFATLALAGCSSNGTKSSAEPVPETGATSGANGINTSGTGAMGNGSAQALGSSSKPDLSKHSVYYDYNQAMIKPEYQGVIDNWSKYLLANPTVRVQLQGNTDERGTRDYNVALGERRAESVASALQAEGVPASQMTVISFGKERPVCTEHDEACWWQNRRTDIVQQ